MRLRRLCFSAACGLIFFSTPHTAAAEKRSLTPEERLARKHYENAKKLLRGETFDEAIVELRQAVFHDPKLIMAHYDLGKAYMTTRDYGRAVDAYKACRDAYVALASDVVSGGLAAAQNREDRIREIREHIRELEQAPTRTALSERQKQLEIVRLHGVLTSLEQMRGDRPGDTTVPAELSLALGSAYFRNDKLEDAEREYKAAVAARPKLGEAHNNLAALYVMTGRAEEARVHVKLAEKAGFSVHPNLKKDIERALADAQAP